MHRRRKSGATCAKGRASKPSISPLNPDAASSRPSVQNAAARAASRSARAIARGPLAAGSMPWAFRRDHADTARAGSARERPLMERSLMPVDPPQAIGIPANRRAAGIRAPCTPVRASSPRWTLPRPAPDREARANDMRSPQGHALRACTAGFSVQELNCVKWRCVVHRITRPTYHSSGVLIRKTIDPDNSSRPGRPQPRFSAIPE